MTKEQILELLKDTITTLKVKNRELLTNKDLRRAWDNQNEMVREAVRGLDSCDMLWLNDHYAEWFKANIQGDLDKILRKETDW